MIYDKLTQSNTYIGVHPLFEMAFNFLKTLPSTIEDGRYPIKGEECYAIIYTADLKRPEEAKLEVHDRYIDVQTVITGVERFGISPRQYCVKPIGAVDTDKDILFFDDAATNFLDVRQGEFAVFMPEDAHAPLIGCGKVQKAVVKVKVGASR